MTGIFPEEGRNLSARRERARADDCTRARVGLRLAGQPSHPLQPGLRRSVRKAVERAEEADVVGRRRTRSDSRHQGAVGGERRSGLRCVYRAERTARDERRVQGHRRDRPVFHARRRQRRTAGAGARRRLPGTLRAVRISGDESAVERAEQPGGEALGYRRRESARDSRSLSLCADHLSADRASRRGNVPARAVALGAVHRALRRDRRGDGQEPRHRERRHDHRRDSTWPHQSARDGDRADQAVRDRRHAPSIRSASRGIGAGRG